MIEAVKKFIIENNLEGEKILVGFSGGADSTVLSDILYKIGARPVLIHLNHNWRGEEAKKDEEFARGFALKRGLEFYTETLSPKIKKNETSAREARYDFFKNCKEKFNAKGVFLAHNKNDNVETLIYRLIKGTGPSGLNSIPKVRDFYFRPLLDFSRAEIEKYAKENGLEYRVDSSNFDKIHKRNLIREEILPKMLQINPEAINALSTFISVNKMNQKIVDSKMAGVNLNLRDEFLSLNEEVQYELINRHLKGVLKNRDFKTIGRIIKFIKENESSKISINKDLFLKVYNNKIYLTKPPESLEGEIPLREGENNFLGFKIIVVKAEAPSDLKEGGYIKLDFNNPYVLRTRKKGDKIQPFGSRGIEKFKTVLIKKKIPSELRDITPLIALGDEVLYFSKNLMSEKLRVDKNDKICYKITITEGN